MNTKIDWHYHLSGRNIKSDIVELKKYLTNMDEVYVMASYFPENSSGLSNYNLYYHLKDLEKTKLYLSLDFENYFYQGYNEMVNILEENPSKIIGIKIYTGYQKVEYDDNFKMVLELARKYNLHVMFHTGFLKGNKEKFHPMRLEDIFKYHPNINFIIAHIGNPYIDSTIYLLNTYQNLSADISGLVDKRIEIAETVGRVRKLADKVNHNQVLFGTDYPMQDYDTTLIFAEEFNQ